MPARNHRPKIKWLVPLFASAAAQLFAAPVSAASDYVNELRRPPLQWIELRKRAVEAENRWRSEREILQHSLFVMGETLSELTLQIEEQSSEAQSAAGNFASSEAKLREKSDAQQLIAEQIERLEGSVSALARFAPPPLAKKIKPSIQLLGGEQTEADSLALRIQSVAAILTQFDQFNKELTEARILKTLDDGATSEVRVLYWGLALAYAITPDGKRAWTLHPQPNEWKWTPQPESAAAIHDLFRAFDKDIAPRFVAAPIKLTDIR